MDITILNRSNNKNILDLSGFNLKNIEFLEKWKHYVYIFLKKNDIIQINIHGYDNLKWIDLSNCKLQKVNLNLINLEYLNLSNNNIQDIDNVECKNLKYLNLSNNTIKKLKNDFKNLNHINLSKNILNDVYFLEDMKELEFIDANNNEIETFPDLSELSKLKVINMKYNKVTEISKNKIPSTIYSINLSNNKIQKVDDRFYDVTYNIYLYNNPLFEVSEQLRSIINGKNSFHKLKIYNDNENVHDRAIQKCLLKNIESLRKDKVNSFDISELSEKVRYVINKNIDANEVHGVSKLNYKEILELVGNRIINSKHKNELMKILETEILESSEICFIGKITRMVNTLSGYFDDITFDIDENDQIYNILQILKNKCKNKNELIVEFKKEMKLRNFDDLKIKQWIDNFEYI